MLGEIITAPEPRTVVAPLRASRSCGWPLEVGVSCAHRHAAVVGADEAGHRSQVHSEVLVLVTFDAFHTSGHAHGAIHATCIHDVGIHHDCRWSSTVGGRTHVLGVLRMGRHLLVVRAVVLVSRLIHVLTGCSPCLSLRVCLGLCLCLCLDLSMCMCLDGGLGLSLCDMHWSLHMRVMLL